MCDTQNRVAGRQKNWMNHAPRSAATKRRNLKLRGKMYIAHSSTKRASTACSAYRRQKRPVASILRLRRWRFSRSTKGSRSRSIRETSKWKPRAPAAPAPAEAGRAKKKERQLPPPLPPPKKKKEKKKPKNRADDRSAQVGS